MFREQDFHSNGKAVRTAQAGIAIVKNTSFALETYGTRAFNYLDNMVDADGLPYFNIFWEEPAEAAHDWPDFGDVMSRQLQGAIMARHMTGRQSVNEDLWLSKVLSYIDPDTGLLTRPQTSFSEHVADLGDYDLTLYALVTAYDDAKDPHIAEIIRRMVDAFPLVKGDNPQGNGFCIKSLMAAARSLGGYQPALEFARECVDSVLASNMLQHDNTYPAGGHMHLTTRTMVGLADYALYTGDPVLFSRVDAAYRYLRTLDPGFGFLPEVVDRQGDVISCETCSLMDYLGLGVTLANNGHPEYWGGIERAVRNHLVESQVADGSWLVSSSNAADTHQFSHRDIGSRIIGAYAGWSSPTHILAARETLHWGGPELRGKTRALQNCCGGSGTHALFIAWKHASRFEDGVLYVNMHIDKLLPQAEIRCSQPFKGSLSVDLKEACDLMIRIPDFASVDDVLVTLNGKSAQCTASGTFLNIRGCCAGDRIEMIYPLPLKEETITIGNQKLGKACGQSTDDSLPAQQGYFNRYTYGLTWKGDTLVRINAKGEMPKTGYSDFDSREVELFYGDEGPGKLYQREHMLQEADPELTQLHCDSSTIDYWRLR